MLRPFVGVDATNQKIKTGIGRMPPASDPYAFLGSNYDAPGFADVDPPGWIGGRGTLSDSPSRHPASLPQPLNQPREVDRRRWQTTWRSNAPPPDSQILPAHHRPTVESGTDVSRRHGCYLSCPEHHAL